MSTDSVGKAIAAAVITGGASGFGLALARRCAQSGADIALLDIDADRAQAEARAVADDYGVTALGLHADVSSFDSLTSAARTVTDRMGRCDLLVANVGVQHFGSVERTPDDVWRWMLDVNVLGIVRTFRAFVPLLRTSSAPRVAITSSANALAPAARLGAYQATKFAVVGVAETIRLEHPEMAVTVVYPSGMPTRHLESSELARPTDVDPGDADPTDLEAMMASRPLTERDLADADVAAANAYAGILAGEPHVITHGDLADPIGEQQAAVNEAVAMVGRRRR